MPAKKTKKAAPEKKETIIQPAKEDIIPPKQEPIKPAEQKSETPKAQGGSNTGLKIVIGCCLGCLIIVILVIVGSVATGGLLLKNIFLPFVKKTGQEMQKEIKKQGGLQNLEKGRNIFEQVPTIASGLKIGQEGTTLPVNFPADFPIYPGASITQARSAEVAGKTGFFVNLETGESLAVAADYYKINLPKAGWTISATFGNDKGTFLTVQKAPQNGLVTISTKEGKTNINIVLGEK